MMKKFLENKNTLSEWAGMLAIGYAVYNAYNALPPSWQGQVFGAGGAAIASFVAPMYLSKWFRFRAKIWTDRMIVQETDSGRPPHLEFFLRRERPSIFAHPIKHLFLPWRIVIGRVNMISGSVSVTKKFVKHVAQTDWLRWECGTNEMIKGDAARHIIEEKSYLEHLQDKDQKQMDTLSTINALHKTGVKLIP